MRVLAHVALFCGVRRIGVYRGVVSVVAEESVHGALEEGLEGEPQDSAQDSAQGGLGNLAVDDFLEESFSFYEIFHRLFLSVLMLGYRALHT